VTRILIVSGSPSSTSRSAGLSRVVGRTLVGRGFPVAYLDIRDLPADALVHADATHQAIRDSVDVLARAEGVVVTTPIYHASIAGILKAWFDLLPRTALAGKAVLPLGTGGSLAHALALDYALRPILQALGARHVVGAHLVTDAQLERTTGGPASPAQVRLHASATDRFSATLEAFLAALADHRVPAATPGPTQLRML